jgi:hypothetical protein
MLDGPSRIVVAVVDDPGAVVMAAVAIVAFVVLPPDNDSPARRYDTPIRSYTSWTRLYPADGLALDRPADRLRDRYAGSTRWLLLAL